MNARGSPPLVEEVSGVGLRLHLTEHRVSNEETRAHLRPGRSDGRLLEPDSLVGNVFGPAVLRSPGHWQDRCNG